jgi:hypothetical protein
MKKCSREYNFMQPGPSARMVEKLVTVRKKRMTVPIHKMEWQAEANEPVEKREVREGFTNSAQMWFTRIEI